MIGSPSQVNSLPFHLVQKTPVTSCRYTAGFPPYPEDHFDPRLRLLQHGLSSAIPCPHKPSCGLPQQHREGQLTLPILGAAMLKDQKWLEEENRVDRIYSSRGRKNLQKLLDEDILQRGTGDLTTQDSSSLCRKALFTPGTRRTAGILSAPGFSLSSFIFANSRLACFSCRCAF